MSEQADLKERMISLRIDISLDKYLQLAIRHDYLLYKNTGMMKKENLSEWVRFLLNRRLTEIIGSQKGG